MTRAGSGKSDGAGLKLFDSAPRVTYALQTMTNKNNAANKIDTSKPWTCPGCGRLMAAGLDARLPVLCHNCRESTRSLLTSEPEKVMRAALGALLRDNGGMVPDGRTDVRLEDVSSLNGVCGPLFVRVFGRSAVKTNVSLQYVADGRGYSADVGQRSGKIGKVGFFSP